MKSRQLSSCTSPLEHRSDSSSSAFWQISSSLSSGIALQHPSKWSATPADLLPAIIHTRSHTHPGAAQRRTSDRSGAHKETAEIRPADVLKFRRIHRGNRTVWCEKVEVFKKPPSHVFVLLSCSPSFLCLLSVVIVSSSSSRPLRRDAAESLLSPQASAALVKVFQWMQGFQSAQLSLSALGSRETDRKLCLHQPSSNSTTTTTTTALLAASS